MAKELTEKEEIAVKKTAEELVLENREIVVKPIIRDHPFFKKGHDGEHTYSRCWKSYGLPVQLSTRSYANPFKSKEEQHAFEEIFNLDKNALTPNNLHSPFWGKFSITMAKDDLTLNLANPDHALMFRVLNVEPHFCPIDGDRENIEFIYELIDEKYANETAIDIHQKKVDAYAALARVTKSEQKMIDLLRLLDADIPKNASVKLLASRLSAIIEQTEKIKGIKNIDNFLEAVNDPQGIMKLFVFDAIAAGEIKVEAGDYRLTENQELIGSSLQKAVDYFTSTKNQEKKLLIQERIKNA